MSLESKILPESISAPVPNSTGSKGSHNPPDVDMSPRG